MKALTTINDLDLHEKLYPYCMRCEQTGNALDIDELKQRFGEHAPLELVRCCQVCKECGKKDEIILSTISNEEMSA